MICFNIFFNDKNRKNNYMYNILSQRTRDAHILRFKEDKIVKKVRDNVLVGRAS